MAVGSDPDCLAHGFRGPASALWSGPSFSPPAGGSDRGVQYASDADTNRLKQYGMRISMSRKGNPDDNPAIGGDNAKAESFFKTLKYEEVYLWEYRDMMEAWESIHHFIEGCTIKTAALSSRLCAVG